MSIYDYNTVRKLKLHQIPDNKELVLDFAINYSTGFTQQALLKLVEQS